MTSPAQLALMVTPLAAYLYLLAIWQAGRHPRVVAGPVDVWLLAFGLGGLVMAGPFGRMLARMIFSHPGPMQWLLLTLIGVWIVSRLARRALPRLVIYHVDREALDSALQDSLGPEPFVRTVAGYEDPTWARGVRVCHSPRWRTAVVEGFGQDPEGLIAVLRPRLVQRLRQTPMVPGGVALVFFGLSSLTMILPLTGHVLTAPHTRAALRVLLERLHGG